MAGAQAERTVPRGRPTSDELKASSSVGSKDGSLVEMIPHEWVARMDQEAQVVFVSSIHAPVQSSTSDGSVPVQGSELATHHQILRLERRRVLGALRRAGLQIHRIASQSGTMRYTCITATEGRLMLEAHRLGIEKRLVPAAMPAAVHMESRSILARLLRIVGRCICFYPCYASRPQRINQSALHRMMPRLFSSSSSRHVLSVAAASKDSSGDGCTSDGAAVVEQAASLELTAGMKGAYEPVYHHANRKPRQTSARLESKDFYRMAYADFNLMRANEFEPYRSPDLFFTPMERQRLVMSIISARPADGGAGIDVSMLLAGKVWRVPLSAPEEAAELAREAEQFGWPAPVPLSDLPPPPPGAFGDQVARLRSVAFRTHHVCSAVFEAFLCTHSPRARFQLAGRINAFPPSILGRPPLDELREYFGEKVAFYFAFMHHYTRWLFFLGGPAVISLLMLFLPVSVGCPKAHRMYERRMSVYNIYKNARDSSFVNASSAVAGVAERLNTTWGEAYFIVDELVIEGSQTSLNLSSPAVAPFVRRPGPVVCGWAGADTFFTPIFALGAAMWAVYFLKHWRRYESMLTFRWNVDDFEDEEPIRAEFYRHPATRHDRLGFYSREAGFMPLGDKYTPYFPRTERRARVVSALIATAILMTCVVIGTLSIYALRLFVATAQSISISFELFGFTIRRPIFASIIASILNAIFIGLSNALFRQVGIKLVDWQNHRYESTREDALIELNFAFQFVNSYISFFYIAFAKPLGPGLFGVQQYDSPSRSWFHVRDECNGDCMQELAMQMFIVVISKQFLRNLMSSCIVPCIRALCRCRAVPQTRVDELEGVAKLDHEVTLSKPRSMYWEYNEMAIQFGYVVMFAAAAPWAATLCLLNNAIERKSDAFAMLYGRQRPKYEGAAGIGAWSQIFELMSYFAIVSNVAILGLTSQSLPGMFSLDSTQVLIICLVAEHSLLLLKFYVAVKLNDSPLWILKSKAYLNWLKSRSDTSDQHPTAETYERHSAALQAEYEDESDLERFWL